MLEMPAVIADPAIGSTSKPARRTRPPVNLDVPGIAEWLAREVQWPGEVNAESIRLNRLWARRHGRIAFELAIPLKRYDQTAIFMLQGGSGLGKGFKSRRSQAGLSPSGLTGLRLANGERDVWICTPDCDRALPAVQQLLDPARLTTVLRGSKAASNVLDSSGVHTSSRVAAYRAGKRCVLKVSASSADGAPAIYLKVFRRPLDPDRLENQEKLRVSLDSMTGGRVCLPRVLSYLPEHRTLITASVPRSARQTTTSPADLTAAAAALAALHGVDLAVPRVHTVRDDFQIACRWVRALRIAGQSSQDGLGRLVVTLGAVANSIDQKYETVLHRDFHSAQLLRDGDRVWLLDFDTLARGHADVDVATFMAHIVLDGLSEAMNSVEIDNLTGTFLSHYKASGGRIDRNRLRFYLPSAMARLGAIHLARGMKPEVVAHFWDLATGYLGGDCPGDR